MVLNKVGALSANFRVSQTRYGCKIGRLYSGAAGYVQSPVKHIISEPQSSRPTFFAKT